MSSLERWLGGSPIAVLLKLLFVSLLVGIVMAALGITPGNIVARIVAAFRSVFDLGFDTVREFGRYILTGAAIVVPVWIAARLLSRPR